MSLWEETLHSAQPLSPVASPKELESPLHTPLPQLVGTANVLLEYYAACGLVMAPRAGIAWGSISCLPVAPFGVKARASSQPGSQLGPGTGSGEKEEATWPFLWGSARAGNKWDNLSLCWAKLAGHLFLSVGDLRPVVSTCARGRRAGLTIGHADGFYSPLAAVLPSCVQQYRLGTAQLLCTMLHVTALLPHESLVLSLSTGTRPLGFLLHS
jgi:hypothetical protein